MIVTIIILSVQPASQPRRNNFFFKRREPQQQAPALLSPFPLPYLVGSDHELNLHVIRDFGS